MPTSTNLRLVLSHELDTEELSLEHDTVVVSPELCRRVVAALRDLSLAESEPAEVIEFPLSARS